MYKELSVAAESEKDMENILHTEGLGMKPKLKPTSLSTGFLASTASEKCCIKGNSVLQPLMVAGSIPLQ
jgi:hypothetical protein